MSHSFKPTAQESTFVHSRPGRRGTSTADVGRGAEGCLPGHTSVGGTLPLTETTVAAFPAGKVELTGARARVLRHGLADDEAIGHELADSLAGVGVANLGDLVGVEPDLVLTAADDRRGEALLGGEVDPRIPRISLCLFPLL